ncbi:tRNA(Ile)-lysidine synthase [Bacillus sp. SORGH_AS 510]|uniref:tRNA lysidine(34) synthetase TilS n=1 Tax=Bacillus sp. SORGH_AS_0510 TaxID=3041771 RepID=UPI002782A15E|nr:tRNA lysidine(34) synthetase TilS [Bacillus sp. SORGH_AS_0510]MDQ1143323.1 tRNA(Ile)-lysidine synthase [Bacillus sp. SORGH_AS_0510]
MLETKVEGYLNRQSFQLDNKQIVVGVSGGPDSLALLHYLHSQKERKNLSIVVAHVDHMFRGAESFEDALFVKRFCHEYEIPFEMRQIDVMKIMEATGKSSQVAAREVRYQFYSEIMEKYNFRYLSLGHHGDDQIETILMRLTRGSSGMARAGIPFTRPFGKGFIFRPFLTVTKDEIEQYCKKHALNPRLDPSNLKSIYSRNRFRQQVLPFLKEENSQVHDHFQRFSEELQGDEAFLLELTKKHLNSVMTKREKGKITIDIKTFLEMPLPLQRRGIQLILNYLYKEKPASLSAVHIDQVFSIIHHREPSGKLDFPNGLKVIRSYLQLTFQFQLIKAKPYELEIVEPGMVILPTGGSMRIDYLDGEIPEFHHPYTALFHVDVVKWPLVIRTRKNGDRMTLKGMQGSKKIKDIFIDQKVPVQDRDTWPVITDSEDCILWLPGLKKSSFEGIDYNAKQYILLTYIK